MLFGSPSYISFVTIQAVIAWSLVFLCEKASYAIGYEEGEGSAPILAVTYYAYPPNIVDAEGHPRGLFVTKLEQIADIAGLTIAWQRSSVEEEVRMLNDGKRAFCTSGKLYSEDRARQWIYIPYIFAFASTNIVVASPSAAGHVAAHDTVIELLRNHQLTGALLNGATYGGRVDSFLRADRPLWVLRTGRSDHQLLTMVSLDRADYAIVQKRQWQMAQATDPIMNQLVVIPTLSEETTRPIYLACSRTLDMSVMRSLADAMASLGFRYRALFSPPEHAN